MVSIIILNHNNKEIITKCLDSVIKYSKNMEYELIVVDNRSTDGSLELLKTLYKDKIILLENSVNGCASGRNIGLRKAKGEYVCFLDSDQFVLQENWLISALDILKNHPEIGAVGWTGGWLNNDFVSGPIFDDYNDFFGFKGNCFTGVTYLGTGGMLVKKEVVDKTGGFDEKFDPAYFEDTDFSFNICKAGYKLCICRQISISHVPHQTTKNLDFNEIFYKNQTIFHNKWFNDEKKDLIKTLPLIKKILVISFYNPFNGCGGQRPVAFVNEAISHGNEVMFVFESGSDMGNISDFPLFSHPKLKLLQHISGTDKYKRINADVEEVLTENEILRNWKPDLVLAHVPVEGLFDLFSHASQFGINTLYDQMDKWDAFPNDIFGKKESEYVKSALCCTSITDALIKENKKRYNINFIKIPNAVYDDFCMKSMPTFDEYKKRCSRKRKKIIYAGALWAGWFDWKLLEYSVKNCPEFDFIIIGGAEAADEENADDDMFLNINHLRKYPNIIFTGPLRHDKLPEYYRDANAAIIPFISNDITKPCSPIKYYEYISSILPVVSTEIDDLCSLPFVSIAKNGENLYEDFVAKLRLAAQKEISLTEYNDLVNFVSVNTWSNRYEVMTWAPSIIAIESSGQKI